MDKHKRKTIENESLLIVLFAALSYVRDNRIDNFIVPEETYLTKTLNGWKFSIGYWIR